MPTLSYIVLPVLYKERLPHMRHQSQHQTVGDLNGAGAQKSLVSVGKIPRSYVPRIEMISHFTFLTFYSHIRLDNKLQVANVYGSEISNNSTKPSQGMKRSVFVLPTFSCTLQPIRWLPIRNKLQTDSLVFHWVIKPKSNKLRTNTIFLHKIVTNFH